ncbi:MAG: hypothetical protein R3D98_04440 [Candidatus Krumholzibacteriia bacterium]
MRPRPPIAIALVLALVLAMVAVAAHGQSARREPNRARQDMQRWLQRERDAMQSYLSEQDREFAAFLRESWRGNTIWPPARSATPPQAPLGAADGPCGRRPGAVGQSGGAAETARAPAAPPAPRMPWTPQIPSPPPTADRLAVSFLGLAYALPVDRSLGTLPRREPGPAAAAEAWSLLSEGRHEPLLDALSAAAEARQLGDWGRFKLLESTAAVAYPDDRDRQALLHWYLGLRLGLDLRLAHARAGFAVLYATQETVYQVEFLMRDQTAYYIHDPAGRLGRTERLRTYDAQPPLAVRPLALGASPLPLTDPDLTTRALRWTLDGEPREASVVLDRRLVAYLGTLPQTRLVSQFRADLSPRALASLGDALAPDLAVRDAFGQVALLLRFVQTSLAYATDQDQFGREDYLYPDEALFYPECDCEDRAALFAVLVRRLVGLEVVGLDYPGHIAAAVALPGDPPGDRFAWHGRDYTVCDPTFIGAGPGRSMPIAGADRPSIIDPTG